MQIICFPQQMGKGATRPGNTYSATLNTCCLTARVSLELAWAAQWRIPFSAMTSFGHVLDLTIPGRRCCHRWSCAALPRPCCCPGPSSPLAHYVAVLGSCRGGPAWYVVCGVHPPAPVRVYVGTLPPACPALRPLVAAPPPIGHALAPAHLPAPDPVSQDQVATCPPLWPMPVWVWRDVRYFFFSPRPGPPLL